MDARPKAEEDEDDLLKLQAQFFQGGQASSGVTIKRPDKRGTVDSNTTNPSTRDVVKMDISDDATLHQIPKKKSKFQMERDAKMSPKEKSQARKAKEEEDADVDMEELMDRKETGLAAVLTSIIERDTRNEIILAPTLSSQGFPNAVQNDRIGQIVSESKSSTPQGNKKKSLFAQQVEAKSAEEFGVPWLHTPNNLDRPRFGVSVESASVPKLDKSYIVSGQGLNVSQCQSESQHIHEENIQTLSSMTEAEILEEQRKLLESTDPKVLEFLQSKRAKQEAERKSREEEMPSTSMTHTKFSKKKNPPTSSSDEPEFNPSIKPSKEWLNMGVIEKEKMEWMTDLPPPDSVSSETGKPARFDFDGKVLAETSEIPVNRGLHHHGDEPERAGYTLQELFTLARSANLQQRILALHTVSKIIRMANCGALVDQIQGPLMPVLFDGGVLILIRLALDDPTEGVVFAAIDAFHAMLCSQQDQEAVSETWAHHLGNLSPSLIPLKTLQKQSEPEDPDEENQEQETDADVVKRDVIVVLVSRMQLLRRFHFVLETMRPQAVVVANMMDILARVAQHSPNMAYEITKEKGLISKIVKEFLPTAWDLQYPSDAVSNVYGLPVPSALRLIRCLCQAGRHLTANLITHHHLLTILLRYLAVKAGSLNLPRVEDFKLQIEALAVWRVCAAYGCGLQIFFDLYTENVKKISKIEEDWKNAVLTGNVDSRKFMKDAYFVCVLERVLYTIGQQQPQHQPQDSPGQQSELLSPSINWSHVKCLFQPVRSCICHMLKAIGQHYPAEKYDLTLPTSCVNFLASFYEAEQKQTDIDIVSRAEDIEGLCEDSLNPFFSSFGFSLLVDNLCPYSNILSSIKSSYKETTPSLPSLNVHWIYTQESDMAETKEEMKECNMPILRKHSPFGFIVSVFRLALNVCKRHKGVIKKLISPLVNNQSILLYMKKICQLPDSTFAGSFWTKTENMLQYLWLKCCLLTHCEDMTLAHRVSLRLLSRFQGGDEYFVHDLFTSVIFSPLFLREGDEIQLASEAMANMNLSENLYLRSATQNDISLSKNQLLREALASLAAMRGHFLMALGGMEKAVMQSRNIFCGHTSATHSQLLPSQGESLLPKDWMYLPLIHVYNKTQQMKNVTSSSMSSQDISMVTSVLQWNYLYEVWRPKEIDHTSITTKVSRVMCAFLAGNDLFLEKKVQTFLAGLLRQFVSPRLLNALNFEERVPGISSFYDLYQEFLDHYESVSFGDPVFGLYVLLPLQQKHSSLYRKAVWGERRKMLRTLRVSFQDCLIPVENFLGSDEDDMELLQLYLHALVTKSVQSVWSPIMFLVAVHHVNHFLFATYDDGNQLVRDRMWKTVLHNFTQMSSLVHYKKFNVNASQGLELYDDLPDNRRAVLDAHSAKNPQ